MAEPIQGGQTAGTAGTAGATGQQDALGMQKSISQSKLLIKLNQYCFVRLDKGVDAALNRAGHGQSHSTTEKISDGIRKVFKKATGKDVPIQDKQ
ncbi:hypothetical protein CNBG_9348 [Cryptococcus deuterogattii R265]|uniref:uncharacterized protein n=1 Tax=Cryptococcus deuterogattii (strain R265) TaxID=294750 RepID=UPI00193853D8|nr:hypothetical protein CNBG_9348 [Cryptococcus deuterogattii R265]